jgi:hypothetical protein
VIRLRRWLVGVGVGIALGGCRPPAPSVTTELEPAASTEPSHFVEAEPTTQVREPDPDLSNLLQGDCPGEVGHYPEPYFGDQLLIRLPKPLTADDVIETGPNRAQAIAFELEGCEGQRVPISSMTLDLRGPTATVGDARDEVLGELGMLDRIRLIETELGPGATAAWVYTVRDVEPAEILLVVVIVGDQSAVVIVYQAPAAGWWSIVGGMLHSSRKVAIVSP